MKLLDQLKQIKESSNEIASMATDDKNKVLESLITLLLSEKDKIFKANKKDIAKAVQNKKSEAFINRLSFTESIFNGMIKQVNQIISQKDPVGEIIEQKVLQNGVTLKKIRVPIGVIAIIYESRPNVTIDAAALCIKSGNAVILKGGSDAINTNTVLASCIQRALRLNGFSQDTVIFINSTDRKIVPYLVKQSAYIDLIIPRGGYDLVKMVTRQSQIPVLYHAAGGARIYIDASADLALALDICINAKTNRPATCNSLDTVVLHIDIAKKFLDKLVEKASEHNIELRGDTISAEMISIKKASKNEFETEYLDTILSIKVVQNYNEAIEFIKKYSKGHSEGIVAADKKIIDSFVKKIDASAVFINCSTRLHDGGIFELGAEMGIATGKLHARGPVGLHELTTYKWIAEGTGQVRE